MRLASALALPLLALAACSVESDSANQQVRVDYDRERIENGAERAARAAKVLGSAAGNVAVASGRAIRNEVGDVDVDIDVSRNRAERNSAEAGAY